jgi:hypothetical protein
MKSIMNCGTVAAFLAEQLHDHRLDATVTGRADFKFRNNSVFTVGLWLFMKNPG